MMNTSEDNLDLYRNLDAEAKPHRNHMKSRQKEFASATSKALEHYRSQLGSPDLDEYTKEIIIENLQFKAYGPPSLSTNPTYWSEIYPGLPKGVSVDNDDEAQLLDDGYWIAAYNSIRVPHATNDDRRVLRKFIRETMSLIRKASATCDVIKVLKNNQARTILFHLVFCISSIINSTSQRQEYRVVFAEKKAEFVETMSVDQGVADASSKPDTDPSSKKVAERVFVPDPTLEGLPKDFSKLDMTPLNSADASSHPEMDPKSSGMDPTVEGLSTPGKKHTRVGGVRAGIAPHQSLGDLHVIPWNSPELTCMMNTEIFLILKEIFNVSGLPLATESSSTESDVISGVRKLINELKKEQDTWNEDLAREESEVTTSYWRRRVSSWSNRGKMQDELSWREMCCSVFYLNDIPFCGTFRRLIDLFDYDELWPGSSVYTLPAAKDPFDTPKPPGSGFFRSLLKKLEKEGLM